MIARARALPALAVALVAAACASPKSPEASRPVPRVVIETAAGARHEVAVEVARTDAERARGLMWRASLPRDAGMLFLFEESEDHGFWMQNTLIPLDMIFVDEGGRIVGIVERAAPGTTELRSVGVPSRFVLEVNGGWTAERRVRAGDRVRFEGVSPY